MSNIGLHGLPRPPAHGLHAILWGGTALVLLFSSMPVLGTVAMIASLWKAALHFSRQKPVPVVIEPKVAQELPPHLRDLLRDVLADGRMTEEETARIVTALDATPGVKFDDQTMTVLARARLLWQYENGQQLPVQEVEIRLKKGETCHLVLAARRFEARRVTVGSRSSGTRASTRAFGMTFHASHVRREPITEDQMVELDEGVLYVTNQRFLFDGRKKNVSISHRKIVDYQIADNGVCLQKDSGPDQYFASSLSDAAVTGAMIQGAIHQAM